MHLHAWAVPREIPHDRWNLLRRDALAVLQAVSARLERGNPVDAPSMLRGPDGAGSLVITPDRIAFNGNGHRGEAGDAFVLERLAQRGYLARADGRDPVPGVPADATGDDGHDMSSGDHDDAPGINRRRAFRRCDTRDQPYDLAVCAVLLVALWHLGSDMRLGTQGSVRSPGWRAAADVVRAVLGVEAQLVQTEYGAIRWRTSEQRAADAPGRSAS